MKLKWVLLVLIGAALITTVWISDSFQFSLSWACALAND